MRVVSNEDLLKYQVNYSPVINDLPVTISFKTSESFLQRERFEEYLQSLNRVGEWRTSAELDHQLHLSVLGNITWDLKERYDSAKACGLLQYAGLKTVHFIGDSYVRQIFAAAVITFTGDYQLGAVTEPTCSGEAQFEDKNCRKYMITEKTVCGGNISLSHKLHLNFDGACVHTLCDPGSLIIWGGGAHGISPNKETRYGVYNAYAYYTRRIRVSELCRSCRPIIWLSTHARPTLPDMYFFDDEDPSYIRTYNQNMRSYIAKGECSNFHFVDVYNMTASLVSKFDRHGIKELRVTYDGNHYGRTINLLKVQVLLNYLSVFFSSTNNSSLIAPRRWSTIDQNNC